jgi:prefoldin subunit 5
MKRRILTVLLVFALLCTGCKNNHEENEEPREIIEAIHQKGEILSEVSQATDMLSDDIEKLHQTIKELSEFIEKLETNICVLNENINEIHKNAEIKINVLEIHNENVVVQNPVMNEATFEIDERLVGRYVAQTVRDGLTYIGNSYFEIKPNGELEIAIMTFSGLADYKNSENLMLTAFYQSEIRTVISFHLIGGRYTFPGSWLSVNFISESNYDYFIMVPPFAEYEDVRFVREVAVE